MARIVSRAEFSRLARVTAQAISYACRNGLEAACVEKRIDRDHPVAVDYILAKGGDPNGPIPRRAPPPSQEPPTKRSSPRSAPSPRSDSSDGIETSVDGLEDLTLQQLLSRFGTVTRFKDWLDARKKIADVREKELKIAAARGTLIAREFVRAHVFGLVDAGNRRLLRDAARTITQTVMASTRAGCTREEVEVEVREILSDHLKAIKSEVTRALSSG